MSDPWRTPPTLRGRHVTLRPLVAADAPALAAAAGDGDLTELFFANVAGLTDPEAFVAAALLEQEYGRALPLTVETPDGRVVGLTRFLRMNEAHRRVEIGGTFYARSVQRSGVNTEAKLLLLTHAFDVLGCQVVQIRTDWFNKRSQAAIERLGAKRDGVLRSHQLFNGRVRDLVVYSIIAAEWPGVRTNLNFLLEKPR
ncbi:GNAT family protein [uncultured Sphingomonas sp.]|uniref:GNAT family N-acetyltransferase n=1 Tax=uncultured Sphingomonas sp. TaxID=158754 RepID=UPI0025825B29|nr:GNAT family protein [uncultured Sphingomonas sp.]